MGVAQAFKNFPGSAIHDMNAKILEVFRSVQGEGPYAGITQVFVRFFECNMHCVWCDTPASIGDTSRNYKETGLEDLFFQVNALYDGCHSVSITGGEPLLQKDFLTELLPRLRQSGMRVYLETNGTLPHEFAQVIGNVDIVAMDVKLPSSTRQRGFWHEHEEFLRIAMRKRLFVKVVISKETADEEMYQAVEMVKRVDPGIIFVFQPNYFDMKEGGGCVAKCVELQKYCSKILEDVRITPQVHKFMKLR